MQGGIATENYTILNNISGVLRPGSITLLLGEALGCVRCAAGWQLHVQVVLLGQC